MNNKEEEIIKGSERKKMMNNRERDDFKKILSLIEKIHCIMNIDTDWIIDVKTMIDRNNTYRRVFKVTRGMMKMTPVFIDRIGKCF